MHYDQEYNRTVPVDERAPEIAPYRNRHSRHKRYKFSSRAAMLATVTAIVAAAVVLMSSLGFSVDNVSHNSAELFFYAGEGSGLLAQDELGYHVYLGEEMVAQGTIPHEKGSLLLSGLSPSTGYTVEILKNGSKVETIEFHTQPNEAPPYEPQPTHPTHLTQPTQPYEPIAPTINWVEVTTEGGFTLVQTELSANDGQIRDVFFQLEGGIAYQMTGDGDIYEIQLSDLPEGVHVAYIYAEYTLDGTPTSVTEALELEVPHKSIAPTLGSVSATQYEGSYSVRIFAPTTDPDYVIRAVTLTMSDGSQHEMTRNDGGYAASVSDLEEGDYSGSVTVSYILDEESYELVQDITFTVAHVPIHPTSALVAISQDVSGVHVALLGFSPNDGEIHAMYVGTEGKTYPMVEDIDHGQYVATITDLSEGRYDAEVIYEYTLGQQSYTHTTPITLDVGPGPQFAVFQEIRAEQQEGYQMLFTVIVDPQDSSVEKVSIRVGNWYLTLKQNGNVFTGTLDVGEPGVFYAEAEVVSTLDGEPYTLRQEFDFTVQYVPVGPDAPTVSFSQADGTYDVTASVKVPANDAQIQSVAVRLPDGSTHTLKQNGSTYSGSLGALAEGKHSASIIVTYTLAGKTQQQTTSATITVAHVPVAMTFDGLQGKQDPLTYSAILNLSYTLNDSQLNSITVTEGSTTLSSKVSGKTVTVSNLSVGDHTLKVTIQFTTAGAKSSLSKTVTVTVKQPPKDLEIEMMPQPSWEGYLSFETSFASNDAKDISGTLVSPDKSLSIPVTFPEESDFFYCNSEESYDFGNKGYAVFDLNLSYTLGGVPVTKTIKVLFYDDSRGNFPGNIDMRVLANNDGKTYDVHSILSFWCNVTIKSARITTYDYMNPDNGESTIYTFGKDQLTVDAINANPVTVDIPNRTDTTCLYLYIVYEVDGVELTMSTCYYL